MSTLRCRFAYILVTAMLAGAALAWTDDQGQVTAAQSAGSNQDPDYVSMDAA